eukprot:COSAG05_NODE_2132_length_3505_cov_2.454492_1_plen_104_part_10
MRRVGHARPPEALRRAAEAAEHAGVELGGDEDEDVVAEEGQRGAELGGGRRAPATILIAAPTLAGRGRSPRAAVNPREGCIFFKQKTAYEMESRDWSSDVCSSD